jgi:hypothetical protein
LLGELPRRGGIASIADPDRVAEIMRRRFSARQAQSGRAASPVDDSTPDRAEAAALAASDTCHICVIGKIGYNQTSTRSGRWEPTPASS